MRPDLCAVPGRVVRFALLLGALSTVPLQADADGTVPDALRALLPAGAELGTQNWEVLDTDPGKSLTGSMTARFPGLYPSCSWSLYKSELTIEISGQSLDETPWMLDQVVEYYESELQASGQSMSEDLARSYNNNSNLKSIGVVQEEQLFSGRIAYIEWTEDCDRHPNGTKTRLSGSARRDATILTFDLVLSATGAEARAMASDMLEKFERLDINALYQ